MLYNKEMIEKLNELCKLTAHAQNRRTDVGLPRVAMVKGDIPEHDLSAVYEPMINLILQGSKSMTVGDQTLNYDPATYFVMSVDLPATGIVRGDSSGNPYLAISLTLSPIILNELFSDLPNTAGQSKDKGFFVANVTPELLDAWLRMMRLMQTPSDIPALAPVYEREILYRIMQGPMGWMLRDIATPNSSLARINQAIQRIRREYYKPMSVDELAEDIAMSVSAFHRKFKAVTALSPLQYQKQVRLLQARTNLVVKGYSVLKAAQDVGYESPTQFSREYARMFGLSPTKDARKIISSRAT